jgi:SAM-dependent methyltransferase
VTTAPPGTASGGYDRDLFETIAALEPASWWFRSRNRLIERTVRERFPAARRVLEVGCGTGFTYAALSRALPGAEILGTELFDDGLRIARQRQPHGRFETLDARHMPHREAFDLVAAFDVLEHIDDDRGALAGMRQAVVPGGGLVVTVPQHPALWSRADTYAHHVRRYRRRELVARVAAAGFTVERVTSFVTFLAPAMALSRLRDRLGAPYDPLAEFRIPRAVDRAFDRIATLEGRLIGSGASLPFGGSLLLVARRA